MSQIFPQWQSRRRLRRLINHATKIIYAEQSEFAALVDELQRRHNDATPEEIHVAIEAVVKIEEEFAALVYSKYKIRDKDVVKGIINEAFSALDEIIEARSDPEIVRLQKEICEGKAKRAFITIRMAFSLEKVTSDESFAGIVYKAKKIKNGPISIEQRKRFKILTDELQKAGAEIEALDEALSTISREKE